MAESHDKLNDGVVADDNTTAQEKLLQMVLQIAIKDYKQCIKGGAFYVSKNVGTKQHPRIDCCYNIISDVMENPIFGYYNQDMLIYIFRKVDNEYRHYFDNVFGSNWVHPVDSYLRNN